MSDLTPIAFDLETSGLELSAVVTVAGFATDVGAWLALNTTGRDADTTRLTANVEHGSGSNVRVSVFPDQNELLTGLREFATGHIDGDRHYVTAFNGELWNGGFDLPFLRKACVRENVEWPFSDIAYADAMTAVDRFDTGDVNDLAGVYETLIGNGHCDPFSDSGSAVNAHEEGDWAPLLLHNLADIERTRELVLLAERYVSKSDFAMKNLDPPNG